MWRKRETFKQDRLQRHHVVCNLLGPARHCWKFGGVAMTNKVCMSTKVTSLTNEQLKEENKRMAETIIKLNKVNSELDSTLTVVLFLGAAAALIGIYFAP